MVVNNFIDKNANQVLLLEFQIFYYDFSNVKDFSYQVDSWSIPIHNC